MKYFVLLIIYVVGCSESGFKGTNAGDSSSSDGKATADGTDGTDEDNEFDSSGNNSQSGSDDNESDSSETGESDSEDDGSDEDLIIESGETSIKLCGTAKEQETSFVLKFASTAGQDCDWGVGINETFKEGTSKIRAFRKQTATIEIPKDSFICDFKMNMEEASVRYDDYMFIDFEHYLLASGSYPESELLGVGMSKTDSGLLKFEPEKGITTLPTTVAVNKRENQYCAPDATCAVAPSDSPSPMDVGVGFDFFTRLPDAIRFGSEFDINLFVSGQGDSKRQDCEHTGITFKGVVTYVK